MVSAKAIIIDGPGKPFHIENVDLEEPGKEEVLVKMVASGLCHTDFGVQAGEVPGAFEGASGLILGHEGSGIIEKLGPEVKGFEVGDHVLLSYASCGNCKGCHVEPVTCRSWNQLNFGSQRPNGTAQVGTLAKTGQPINGSFFGQSSFGSYSIVRTSSCVKVSKDVDLKLLAPLGCGIQTGAGAVMNFLKPDQSQSIGVWGLGGVGLSALLAAKYLGLKTIIAIDINKDRLAFAKELGATHTIDGRSSDIPGQISKITEGELLNCAVEATGIPTCVTAAYESLGVRGTQAQIGAVHPDHQPKIALGAAIANQKRLCTVLEGNANPQEFIPKLIEMVKNGDIPLERFSKTFSVDNFDEAAQSMKNGQVIKPIILF